MRSRLHRVFGTLLAALFLSYYAGSTLFVHTHQTSDGRSVTHSHPYLPSSAHGHSAAGFAAIDSLGHLWFYAATAAAATVLGAVRIERGVEKACPTRAARIAWSPLRGPPAVC